MEALNTLFEASLRVQERLKKAPNLSCQVMLEQTLQDNKTELDEADYCYLMLFLEALLSAKNCNTSEFNAGSRLLLLSHSISEFASKAE